MKGYEFCRLLSSETWGIRAAVLWPEKAPGPECKLDADDQEGTFHFGVKHQSRVVSVGTFLPQEHPELNAADYRLRAMATDVDFRNKGVGRALILGAMAELRAHSVKGVWADARHSALGFYARLDWEVTGPSYVVPKRGLHRLVWAGIGK